MTRGPDPKSFDRLVAVEAAVAALLTGVEPVDPRALPLDVAEGRVSAAAIMAHDDHPRDATARRDGWAIAAHESVGATPYAPVPSAGFLHAVRAGEIMPEGTDAVLPPRALGRSPSGADILQAIYPGHAVRAAGEDVRRGQMLLETGCVIGCEHAALLALAGFETVLARAPRLAIMGAALSPALAHLIEAWARKAGAVLTPDETADVVVELAAPGYAGTRQAIDALAKTGTVVAHGIAAAPGDAIGFGQRRDGTRVVPVIVVPATPEDGFVAWLLVLLPVLRRLSGLATSPRYETLPLARKVASAPGLTDLVLVRRSQEDSARWEVLAVGDTPWSAILRAEAFAFLPPASEGFPAGASLTATML